MLKTNNNSLENVTVVDLCCGIGSFNLAFSSFGAKTIFACEIDEKAQAIYEKNHHLKPLGDIYEIDANDVPDHDILCAGLPCQPFSVAGKGKGFNDDRAQVFFEFVRIAKVKQPKVIFIENVKGLKNIDNGKALEKIIDKLNNIGYDVFYEILTASDYNVPQRRQRIYILAFRKDMNIKNFSFPKPEPLKVHVKDILQNDEDTSKYEIHRNDFIMKREDISEVSNGIVRLGHVNKGGQGEWLYSINGAAATIIAKGGGIGGTSGMYLVDSKEFKVKKLSPRECARLQGFPDNFILPDHDRTAYMQVGNAIVIDVLQKIIGEIVKNKEIMSHLKK
jgi:DNA (cytosine-5)-methyltransferase 1